MRSLKKCYIALLSIIQKSMSIVKDYRHAMINFLENKQVIFLIYSSYSLYFLCFFRLSSHATWESVESGWEMELALLMQIWTSISSLQSFSPSHLLPKLDQ